MGGNIQDWHNWDETGMLGKLEECCLDMCVCACVHDRGYKIAKPTFHLTIRLEERE